MRSANGPGDGAAHGRPFRETELHEVKVLNKHLTRLRDDFGLRAEVLLPREVTGDEPPPRFLLQREGESYPLLDLRALVATVRTGYASPFKDARVPILELSRLSAGDAGALGVQPAGGAAFLQRDGEVHRFES